MKVFVSWSGDLSKQIAQTLKTWLPRLIQSVEVFYSPEDIEKGDNWDSKISQELSTCNYGIICLTSENTSAPWIHFEAGALAKALDAKVSTLMVNINPSDIKGPLSRYQATRLEKDDFSQLISSINKALDSPLDSNVITPLLDALWSTINAEFETAKSTYSVPSPKAGKKEDTNAPLEEILQLLRKQYALLSSPEELLPVPYFEYLKKNVLADARHSESSIPLLLRYIKNIVDSLERCDAYDLNVLNAIHFDEIFYILDSFIHRNYSARTAERYEVQLRDLHDHYDYILRRINAPLSVPVP